MHKAYTHHLRCLPPAEELQRDPEQFWTVKRSLFFAAVVAAIVIHHSNWSSSL